MTQFMKKSFLVALGSKAYVDGWDATFGKKPEPVPPEGQVPEAPAFVPPVGVEECSWPAEHGYACRCSGEVAQKSGEAFVAWFQSTFLSRLEPGSYVPKIGEAMVGKRFRLTEVAPATCECGSPATPERGMGCIRYPGCLVPF